MAVDHHGCACLRYKAFRTQISQAAQCGGLGGLATDGDWIYALDSQKGHVLAFTAKAPAAFRRPAILRRRHRNRVGFFAARKEAASKAKEAKGRRNLHHPQNGTSLPLPRLWRTSYGRLWQPYVNAFAKAMW